MTWCDRGSFGDGTQKQADRMWFEHAGKFLQPPATGQAGARNREYVK